MLIPLLFGIMLGGCASSQNSSYVDRSIHVGDRVKLTNLEGEVVIGTLAAIVDSTAFLAEGVSVPTAELQSIHVSHGVEQQQAKGAAIGGLIGLGVGTALGIAFGGGDDPDDRLTFGDVLPEMLAFGLGGSMAGYWAGTLAKHEIWVEIPPGIWRSP